MYKNNNYSVHIKQFHMIGELNSLEIYCDVPGSPCLSKKWVPGPVLSLPGAKVVCWRPHFTGTPEYLHVSELTIA